MIFVLRMKETFGNCWCIPCIPRDLKAKGLEKMVHSYLKN